MKKAAYNFIVIAIFVAATFINANAENINIQSYGHYKKMIHMKKTEGVVNLQEATPSDNFIRCWGYSARIRRNNHHKWQCVA